MRFDRGRKARAFQGWASCAASIDSEAALSLLRAARMLSARRAILSSQRARGPSPSSGFTFANALASLRGFALQFDQPERRPHPPFADSGPYVTPYAAASCDCMTSSARSTASRIIGLGEFSSSMPRIHMPLT